MTAYLHDRVSHQSVLDSLGAQLGDVPRVLLRDPEEGDQARNPERDAGPDSSASWSVGRYRVHSRIDGGAMGDVFRGRDTDLGREVALKALREEHREDTKLAQRFVEEAQIGGQLVHPGIVPTYELGTLADGRPFFTMKLVKGHRLYELLAARPTPAADLPRFLAIFQQVCQTVAYAHARGVIHRDLKPLNIMVGSFGEVQVMDWGLAKVLPRDGRTEREKPSAEPAPSMVSTVRSSSPDGATDGALGTPAYMAPEQAGGEIASVDERADVFGLGSILCEVLTGKPAYTGGSQRAIILKAQRGDTADALSRLDTSGADRELIELARRCLSVDPEERLRHAGEVAGAIAAHAAGVQERLRKAELERAGAEARADEETKRRALADDLAREATARANEERKRRRVTAALAASILIAGGLGAGGWTWIERDRAARAAARTTQVSTALQEAAGHQVRAKSAKEGDLVAWTQALDAAQRARDLLEPGLDPALREQVERLLVDVDAGRKTAEAAGLLLDRLADIRSRWIDSYDAPATEGEYAEAFREAGIDAMGLPPAEAGARIRSQRADVALELTAALDHWADMQRFIQHDDKGANHLLAVARAADPNPWRDQLRSALQTLKGKDRSEALQRLARSAAAEDLPSLSFALLGLGLQNGGDRAAAGAVFRQGLKRHPRDAWLILLLADCLSSQGRTDEAIRYYFVARFFRSETAHTLAHALEKRGETDAALATFQDLVTTHPDVGRHWACYGKLLEERGDRARATEVLAKAVELLRREIQRQPNLADVHVRLALALSKQGKPDEAIAEYRTGIRIEPGLAAHAWLHNDLGLELRIQGKLDEAVAELRTAIQLKPDLGRAHGELGCALQDLGKLDEAIAEQRIAIRFEPTLHQHHENLAGALSDQAKRVEAIAEYREAIRLDPNCHNVHQGLGRVLARLGRLDEAIAEYRTAIRIKPDFAGAHVDLGAVLCDEKNDYAAAEAEFRTALGIEPDDHVAHDNLGNALSHQGKLDEAITEHRTAIRIKPDYALAHSNLGVALCDQGKLGDAIAECREAIRLEPSLAMAHNSLGSALRDQGKIDEAGAEYRTATRIKPDDAVAHNNLGNALRDQGKLEEAIAEYCEAIRIKPAFGLAHSNLGLALADQGKLEEAISEYRAALRIKPDYADAHNNLGLALNRQKKLDEAIAEFRKAIQLKPDFATARYSLGNALHEQHKLDEAIAEYRKAIQLKPDYAEAHGNIGVALCEQHRLAEAIAEFRAAIRIKPEVAGAHNNLARALAFRPNRPTSDYDEGLQHAREAVEISPFDTNSYNTLALAEYRMGHWDESLAACDRSIALGKGGVAHDWFFQAIARAQKGDRDQARGWFDKAITWTKQKDPKNKELLQFWAEAAELLGQPGPRLPTETAVTIPENPFAP
jgi:serine/threonine-protein kinase